MKIFKQPSMSSLDELVETKIPSEFLINLFKKSKGISARMNISKQWTKTEWHCCHQTYKKTLIFQSALRITDTVSQKHKI